MSNTRQEPPEHFKVIVSGNPVVDFLMRLKIMDANYVTTRDVLCLYSIIRKPGMNQKELSEVLNLHAPVNVLANVNRLMRWGYIEDRRLDARRAIASILHPTPAGIDFWERIKP